MPYISSGYGLLLYDADRIEETAKAADNDLVAAQRNIILDPHDSTVVAAARKSGISDDWIAAAQKSPVYRFVKEWELALPLHPEFRTLPMLFYIPPLLPVIASTKNGNYDLAEGEFFGNTENARIPMKYMANLFTAGNVEMMTKVFHKLWAVRVYNQANSAGNISKHQAETIMTEAGCTADDVEQISRLISLPRFDDRFVIPPYHREMVIEQLEDPSRHKGQIGFGFNIPPKRGL